MWFRLPISNMWFRSNQFSDTKLWILREVHHFVLEVYGITASYVTESSTLPILLLINLEMKLNYHIFNGRYGKHQLNLVLMLCRQRLRIDNWMIYWFVSSSVRTRRFLNWLYRDKIIILIVCVPGSSATEKVEPAFGWIRRQILFFLLIFCQGIIPSSIE